MASTSLSLLDRARSDGGEDSWTRLVSIYTPLLKSWMQRHGLQDSDADDIVQEVLLAVARELPKFAHNGQAGAFRCWLKTIMVHRVQNFWRTRRHRLAHQEGSSLMDRLTELPDETSGLSRIWDAEHDRHVLARLLVQVRPRFEGQTWAAFEGVMFQGESPDAVAATLGMAVHSVYVAKSRVLNALRQEAAGLVDDAQKSNSPRASGPTAGEIP